MMRKRIIQNLGGAGFGVVVRIFGQLLLVPAFLSAWGTKNYALWLVLTAFCDALGVLDFGLHPAGGNAMALAAARNQAEDMRRIWWSVAVVSTWVFGLALAVGAIVLLGGLVPRSLAEPYTNHAGSILWFIVWSWLNLQQQGGASLFQAVGATARGLAWQNGVRFAEVAVILSLVWFTKSMIVLAVAMAGVRAVGLAASLVDCHHRAGRFFPTTLAVDRGVLSALKQPALASAIFPAGHALLLPGFTWIVNALLGPVAVVGFANVRTLARVLVQGLGILNAASAPEYTRLLGAGDFTGARQLHRMAFQTTFLLGGLGCIALVLAGAQIVIHWTRGEVQPSTALITWLSISAFGTALWNMHSTPLRACNLNHRLTMLYLASCVCAWLAAFSLVPIWGVTGAALAALIVDVVLVPWTTLQACRITGDTWTGLWRNTVGAGNAGRLLMGRTPRPR